MQEREIDKNKKPLNGVNLEYLAKVGALIKSSRESKELSLEELANSLKIGKEQLIAIEDADTKDLPELVFIKAMIRRISEKLNLDTSLISTEENSSPEENLEKKDNKIKRRIVLFLTLIVAAVLGITASIYLIKYINSTNQPSETVIKTFKEL